MNNKKLFKGALVLFASILMAVSCSNNSTGGGNDGNGDKGQGGDGNGGTKKVVTLDQVQTAIKGLKKVATSDNKGSIDFSAVTLGKEGAVAVNAVKGTTALSAGELKKVLGTSVSALKLDNTTVELDITEGAGWTTATDTAAKTFKIKFTASEGYSFEGFNEGDTPVKDSKLTITVTVTPKDTNGESQVAWEA